jgi:hypothetical protein
MSKQDDAMARETRYVEIERRIGVELDASLWQDALAALSRCPRRSGLPALGSYYCECPACTPEDWGLKG